MTKRDYLLLEAIAARGLLRIAKWDKDHIGPDPDPLDLFRKTAAPDSDPDPLHLFDGK
jgi:hypothetical protein